MSDIKCPLCGQEMNKGNMSRHLPVCKKTSGTMIGDRLLTVKEIKKLRQTLRPTGWTVDEYITAHRKQNGRCYICGGESIGRRLCADHCHTSGKKRRLLCDGCNLGLGAFKDNPRSLKKALLYVLEHSCEGK